MSRTAYFLSGPMKGRTLEMPEAIRYYEVPTVSLPPASFAPEDRVPNYDEWIEVSKLTYMVVGKHNDTLVFDVMHNAR